MQDRFEIRTTKHWKALSHPLRVNIVRLLQEDSLTNEELAKRLGVESGKLHYHTRCLLNAGLIELVETRMRGPILEKVYRALARNYVAVEMPDPVHAVAPPFEGWIANAVSVYRNSWKVDPTTVQEQSAGYHFLARMPEEKAAEFRRKFKELSLEFDAAHEENEDLPRYSIGVIISPVFELERDRKRPVE